MKNEHQQKIDKAIGICIATVFSLVCLPWILYVLYDEKKKWKEHGPKEK